MNQFPSHQIINLGLLAKKDHRPIKFNRFINYFCFSTIAISTLLLWESPNNPKQQSLSLACTILALSCLLLKAKTHDEVESNFVNYRR